MSKLKPGTEVGVKKQSATNGGSNGWTFSVRRGMPSAAADERWANRGTALAAWLVEQYEQHRREQVGHTAAPNSIVEPKPVVTPAMPHTPALASPSSPTSLDPSEHRATPDTGLLEAEGERQP